jgi:hypothetical protein
METGTAGAFAFRGRVRIVLCVTAALTLFACGGGGTTTPTSSAPPPTSNAPPNTSPVATDDIVLMAPATTATIMVLQNDTDAEGHSLRPELVGAVANGTVVINENSSISFTPSSGFAGSTSFQYRAVDSSNEKSNPATVAITIRPLNSVVYVTEPGANHRIVYGDAAGEKTLSLPISSTSSIDSIQLSQDRQTLIWSVKPTSGTIGWFRADVAANANAQVIAGMPNSGASTVMLSPNGKLLLESEGFVVGFYMSNVVYLLDLQSGTKRPIHSAPATDQILSYRFSQDSQTIFYRTNLPARFDSGVTYRRVSVADPQLPLLLWQAAGVNDTGSTQFALTPNATKFVFAGSIGNASTPANKYYVTSATSYSGPQPLGPATLPSFSSLNGFNVSPTSKHVAFSTRDSFTPPMSPVYVSIVDLESPAVDLPVGLSFTVGTKVGVPVFSRDGNRVTFSVSSSSTVAMYEIVLANPNVLTRISPQYPNGVTIGDYEYTATGHVVYAADPAQSGRFGLFVAQDGSAPQLNQDMGTSISVNSSGDSFMLSSDGNTVAYAQPQIPAGPLSLYIVDVSTPGLPTLAGTGVKEPGFGPLQFGIQ